MSCLFLKWNVQVFPGVALKIFWIQLSLSATSNVFTCNSYLFPLLTSVARNEREPITKIRTRQIFCYCAFAWSCYWAARNEPVSRFTALMFFTFRITFCSIHFSKLKNEHMPHLWTSSAILSNTVSEVFHWLGYTEIVTKLWKIHLFWILKALIKSCIFFEGLCTILWRSNLVVKVKVKFCLWFNWASRHEGVLGEWR